MKCIDRFGIIREVYYEDEFGKLLSNSCSTRKRSWWTKEEIHQEGIKEYREPRRLEGWVNVFDDRGKVYFAGFIHETEELAAKCVTRIGVAKIEWVEGQT